MLNLTRVAYHFLPLWTRTGTEFLNWTLRISQGSKNVFTMWCAMFSCKDANSFVQVNVRLKFRLNSAKRLTGVVDVDAEWSATGDGGDSADEGLLDDLCEWHSDGWHWWWPRSVLWQVQKRRVSSFHPAGIGVLILASDSDRLARLANWSMGQASAEKSH